MFQTRSFSKIPLWLEKFVHLFEGGASLVGPTCSCEIDVHIQTWTAMFSADIADSIKLHLLATCAPNLPWFGAISLSEVGTSTSLLANGYSLASLHPSFPVFTDHHRDALRNGVIELREKLFHCNNPLLGEGGEALSKRNLSETVFVKYGGEIWRKKLIPPTLVEKIISVTREKFPASSVGIDDVC